LKKDQQSTSSTNNDIAVKSTQPECNRLGQLQASSKKIPKTYQLKQAAAVGMAYSWQTKAKEDLLLKP